MDSTMLPVRRAAPMLRYSLYCLLCALGGLLTPIAQAADSLPFDSTAQRLLACTACHGPQGRAGRDAYYPRIGGKPEGYLYNQLRNFRDGRRQYPQMTYLLDQLSDAYLHEIAHYFASQHPPYPPPPAVEATPAELELGRQLATHGAAGKNIPACTACHGARLTGVAPAIPGLLGLPRDYINAQFGAWRNNTRRAASPDCMAQIANRLSLAEINAASAWLSSQALPADPTPAPRASAKLPLACGSVTP